MTERKRLPAWLKKRLPTNGAAACTARVLEFFRLSTVCWSARCPNMGECYSRRVATFMIMGDICTRNCGFCGVRSGRPVSLEPDEPHRVAAAARDLGLGHVVITSVTRDDLPDGGAAHFAATINAVREVLHNATIEVLVPDFLGDDASIRTVLQANPEIYNHNVETVPRLYPSVRPEANYQRSLDVLKSVKKIAPDVITKSGMMLGLGERDEEVIRVLSDLRRAGCEMLTLGQYLRPEMNNLPVAEFISPEVFERYERLALSMGFNSAYCGPFVRSSYNAAEFVEKAGR